MVAIESGQRVEWTAEENYKFKLSAFGDRLLEWIDENPKGIDHFIVDFGKGIDY